jgi:beta-1,4-mannosyltransferase
MSGADTHTDTAATAGDEPPGLDPSRRYRRWDDWSLRWSIILIWVVATIVVHSIGTMLFRQGRMPVGGFEEIVALNSVWWLASLPAVAIGLACWLVPRKPHLRRGGRVTDDLVSFRIVSRGRNADALFETVEAARASCRARPLFRYQIEVVTDVEVILPDGDDIHAIVVPSRYVTLSDTRFKARALQYALENSDLPPEAWIVHLDEESHATPGLMGGIRDFIVDCEETGQDLIGQGCILYNRQLQGNWFLTLADSLRTGDDASRFYLQYRMGVALFGMHGSFIVVRNRTALETGFDVGPEGSITEDAWWALTLLKRREKFAWVDGFIVEQAPTTVPDFLKQRRRWYSGLWKVALYAPAPWWARLSLMFFMAGWTLSCVGVMYTIANLFLGLYTNEVVAWLAAASFAWYLATYTYGLHLNLRFAEVRLSRRKRIVLHVAQIVLVPVFGVLEAIGVFYAVLRPERGFHVIEKPSTPAGVPQAA